MRQGAARIVLVLLACSCGLQHVELDPYASRPDASSDANEYETIGDVPMEAIERLLASSEFPKMGVDLLYPATELVIPGNLAPIGFEWRAGPKPPMPMMPVPGMPMMPAMPMMPEPPPPPKDMKDMPKDLPKDMPKDMQFVFELSAAAGDSVQRVYTRGTSASLKSERWSALLGMAFGGNGNLRVRVRALRSDGMLLGSKPLDIEVRAPLPAGEIVSWSATLGGLARAAISSSHETRLAVPDSTGCVGCHAVSRDGKRMLAATGDESRLIAWSSAGGAPLALPLSGSGYAFGSFDMNARIAVAQGSRLAIFDADTGLLLGERSWPAQQLGSLDWSPEGGTLAIAVSDGLSRVRVGRDASLGDLEPLLGPMPMPMPKDERVLHPSYSPDGTFIVFEKQKGPARDAKDGSLWIVPAVGGEALELAAAVSGAKPASAPSFLPGDAPDRAYVVFAARRPVGSFQPAEGQRQLFAAALDLSRAQAGEDPSHTAFWLPFQQRSSSYLGVQWAAATLARAPAPAVCEAGQVEQNCCMPQAERCGNGADEDCDGTVDEGCGCAFQERCDDGVDNDCDLSVDEQPCMPGGK